MECPKCGKRMKCRLTIPVREGRWRYREYRCQVGDCRLPSKTIEYPIGGWSPRRERDALDQVRGVRQAGRDRSTKREKDTVDQMRETRRRGLERLGLQ